MHTGSSLLSSAGGCHPLLSAQHTQGCSAAAIDSALPANVDEFEDMLGQDLGSHSRAAGISLPAGYIGGSTEGLRHGLGYQQWPLPLRCQVAPDDASSNGAAGGSRECRGECEGGGDEEARRGVWYAGQFVEDVPEGLGAFGFDDAALYVGACHAGQPHGWGHIQETSREFIGAFRHGLPHGQGLLQLTRRGRPSGPRYAVDMRHGLPTHARALAAVPHGGGNTSCGARGLGSRGCGWWLSLPTSPTLEDSLQASLDAQAGCTTPECAEVDAEDGIGEQGNAGRGGQGGEWWHEACRVVLQARRVWSAAAGQRRSPRTAQD